jgi:hypothetical protein
MINHCDNCEVSLNLYSIPDGPEEPQLVLKGEADCCCGDYDEGGNHINSLCTACCGPHGNEIYEGKSTGGGYYIVNPSY